MAGEETVPRFSASEGAWRPVDPGPAVSGMVGRRDKHEDHVVRKYSRRKRHACEQSRRMRKASRANVSGDSRDFGRLRTERRPREELSDRSTYLVGYRLYVFRYRRPIGFICAWTTWFQILKPWRKRSAVLRFQIIEEIFHR
jgi:hypothetical protein